MPILFYPAQPPITKPAGRLLFECFGEDCEYAGNCDETFAPASDPEDFHCPKCMRRLSLNGSVYWADPLPNNQESVR